MFRVLPIAVILVVSPGLVGCAGTWDTITSRKFRKEPFNTTYRMWNPEDPMVILRADPPRDGDERAKAMHRLKEPLANGLTQQDQDWAIDLLGRTATSDPSPVLRVAAIEALGRFEDQRVANILMQAYQKAHGRPDGAPDPVRADPGIQLVGASSDRVLGRSSAPLTAPTGFAPEAVGVIRCNVLEAIGRTNRPEVVRFLATVATTPAEETSTDGPDEREIRLAAIRGLGKCRQPEAVAALAQVLSTENGKDTAIVGRAHDGLVHLTGKRLPPEPQKWNEVVQAGVTIAPEPTWVDSAVQTAAGWFKR